jgi:hypothetical protein
LAVACESVTSFGSCSAVRMQDTAAIRTESNWLAFQQPRVHQLLEPVVRCLIGDPQFVCNVARGLAREPDKIVDLLEPRRKRLNP